MGCHGVVYYTKRKVIGMLFDTTSYLLEQIGPFAEKADVQICRERVVSTVWKFDRTKGTFVEMSAEER